MEFNAVLEHTSEKGDTSKLIGLLHLGVVKWRLDDLPWPRLGAIDDPNQRHARDRGGGREGQALWGQSRPGVREAAVVVPSSYCVRMYRVFDVVVCSCIEVVDPCKVLLYIHLAPDNVVYPRTGPAGNVSYTTILLRGT